ncbi:carboxypeptidase-like regulatory domain-containing protein [Pseudoalteromonas rubra]|uniref:carboxypeptidase-like regulatory domain-containing protein n=1 Tax=Pseudoalteromonas rubra TaxID=43658 RepID=UPI002DBEAEA2|nr:carboxypeptidase-like regulatory domain-containing protein [Pseudoalteromonas rubra]MEC4088818.1 carboxypeptidase-like regulatory domain-containing protein [Pseudoalteromonas rubra]
MKYLYITALLSLLSAPALATEGSTAGENYDKSLARSVPVEQAAAVGMTPITFSEFPNGTAITNQYADRGIIFGGDSPFITSDSANPTTPVLSGSPRFNGAIEGRFVDPQTGEPTTVNSFSLDAGYFDNLSSTRLQWFNPEGQLIREVLDSQFGIEHFSIRDENIASFRIEIIAQEDAGYAIDNVAFNLMDAAFDHTFNLDKVILSPGSLSANQFSVYFKNLEALNGAALADVCNYQFHAEDSSLKVTAQNCDVSTDKKTFRIDFALTQAPYNLSGAQVSVCKEEECEVIDDVNNLNVYTTAFNVSTDGFSFQNGDWNRFMLTEVKDVSLSSFLCWKFDRCTPDQLSYLGFMRKVARSFAQFLAPANKRKAYDVIGYYRLEDYTQGLNRLDRRFLGVCHGMAASAIANYNNASEGVAWGANIDATLTRAQLTSTFQSHWDNRNSESPKPYVKAVGSYDVKSNAADAFHGLSKIGYYFLSQSAFKGSAWIGSHPRTIFPGISAMNAFYSPHFMENKIASLRFSINRPKRRGGHSILAAGLIQYNDVSLYITHDNNFPGEYTMMEFTNGLTLKHFIFFGAPQSDSEKYDQHGDFKLTNYYSASSYAQFGAYTDVTDQLRIYGQPGASERANDVQNAEDETPVSVVELEHPQHITVLIAGGRLVGVNKVSDQSAVVLQPILDEPDTMQAYLKNAELVTEFILPLTDTYSIQVEKYPQYPEVEVYVTIPQTNGKVLVLNYEDVLTQSDEDSATVQLTVGQENENANISINGVAQAPTYAEESSFVVAQVSALKAIVNGPVVSLSWQNPQGSNLKEVVVTRTVNSLPTSIDDGARIFTGLESEFVDSAFANTRYYYNVYSVADDSTSEPNSIYVDTHQATLHGKVSDASEMGIASVEVVLTNGVGLSQVEIARQLTDTNGIFSFANLAKGLYKLSYSHASYRFDVSDDAVNLTEPSQQVNQLGVAVPVLLINVENAIGSEQQVSINWSGLHIADSDTVDIVYQVGDETTEIATGVAFSQGRYLWDVSAPGDTSISVQIMLSDDKTVISEQQVFVLKEVSPFDFSGDSVLSADDVTTIVTGWSAMTGDTQFDPRFDLNEDGEIDLKDIMQVVAALNQE